MIEFTSAEQRDLPLLFQLIDEYGDISSIDYDRVMVWVRKNPETHLQKVKSRHMKNHVPALLSKCPVRYKTEPGLYFYVVFICPTAAPKKPVLLLFIRVFNKTVLNRFIRPLNKRLRQCRKTKSIHFLPPLAAYDGNRTIKWV